MTDDVAVRPPVLKVRLRLPYTQLPAGLSGNSRAHWRVKAKSTRQVRADVTTLAKSAGLHRYLPGQVAHVTVQLVWAPGDRRRRDADNCWPLLKVAADALARGRSDLVGIDLVPDDAPEFMEKLQPLILPPPAPAAMWLDIWVRLAAPAPDVNGETA